jgi:hypothetical protein
MRRIMMFGLLIALGGCEGYNTWWNPPFTSGTNPNMPRGDSINLRRVMGAYVAVTPLTPEPGDIWPGPVPEMPTLQDVERDSGMGERLSAIPPMGAPPVHPLAPNATPPARDPAGRIINAPSGPSVTTGGTSGYSTTITPRGSAIVVPNGNGTSTIIHPDGRIETVPTPR